MNTMVAVSPKAARHDSRSGSTGRDAALDQVEVEDQEQHAEAEADDAHEQAQRRRSR